LKPAPPDIPKTPSGGKRSKGEGQRPAFHL
jgi:hypothetical protein